MQNPAGNLIFLAFMFGAFYFLLIRPQRRRQEQTRQMQTALELGDEVMTQGGLIVTIRRLDGDSITVELSPGVEARMTRRAVVGKVHADVPEDYEPTQDVEEYDDEREDREQR